MALCANHLKLYSNALRVSREKYEGKSSMVCTQTVTGAHDPISILTTSTLFPNAIQPSHGIFVETRLRKLVADGKSQLRFLRRSLGCRPL